MSSRNQRLAAGKAHVARAVVNDNTPAIVEPKTVTRVRVLTRATTLLSDALEVLAFEVACRRKSIETTGEPMTHEESETFGRHVRSMTQLLAEQRESKKGDDRLSQITDEQLIPLARAAIKEIEGK